MRYPSRTELVQLLLARFPDEPLATHAARELEWADRLIGIGIELREFMHKDSNAATRPLEDRNYWASLWDAEIARQVAIRDDRIGVA